MPPTGFRETEKQAVRAALRYPHAARCFHSLHVSLSPGSCSAAGYAIPDTGTALEPAV